MKPKDSAVAGVICLILLIPLIVLTVMREELSTPSLSVYYFISAVSMIAGVIFLWGFVMIAKKNIMLKRSAQILAALGVVVFLADISMDKFLIMSAILSIIIGITTIFFGTGLVRMKRKYSKPAGILEIITGCLFISVIFGLLAVFTAIPAAILEVMILLRVEHKSRTIGKKT